ncbi:MAG: cupin domain-containing protein [Candidatus Delongbacteria bacterium]|jgi:quercetin dioxygenase-like cupin family protein|nr:cupin domain-containing protein [Candidatus Delongbacteria bacterium]
MKTIDPNTLEVIYDQDGIIGRKMTVNSNFEIIHMTLQAGSYLKPHKTPFDSEFFIHKGDAVLLIGDEKIQAKEGTIMACPGEVDHGLRNDSGEVIIILVIKKFK